MARFEPIKGPGRYYLDTLTGQKVTKRFRDTTLRGAISNEKAAQLNRITNLELAVSRPARGRKGIKGLSEKEKADIIAARIEDEKRKKELAAQAKAERELNRLLQKKSAKKVNFKHFSDRALRPGSKGARFSFNSYDEYLVLAKEVKASRNTLAYSLGMVGYHETTGEDYGVTVFTLKSAQDKPYSRETFEEGFEEAITERTYFRFQYYFMHVAYKKEYYEKVFADYQARVKAGKRKPLKVVRRSVNRK